MKIYAISLVLILAVIGIGVSSAWVLRITGFATDTDSGITNVTVEGEVDISLPTNTVDFGSMAQNTTNSTEDNNPAPFEVQNDGSVPANVTIIADDILWEDNASSQSQHFQFKCGNSPDGQRGINCPAGSITTLTDMPGGTDDTDGNPAELVIKEMASGDNGDLLEVEISVYVPGGEKSGAKGSTITFTGSNSAV